MEYIVRIELSSNALRSQFAKTIILRRGTHLGRWKLSILDLNHYQVLKLLLCSLQSDEELKASTELFLIASDIII